MNSILKNTIFEGFNQVPFESNSWDSVTPNKIMPELFGIILFRTILFSNILT